MNQSVERILKIGPHLPKLLTNIKWLTFLRHSVYLVHYCVYSLWAASFN